MSTPSERSETAVYAIGVFNYLESATAREGRHELDALTERTRVGYVAARQPGLRR